MLTEKDVERIRAFIKDNDIEHAAEKILFVLGFKNKLQGTRFLKDALVKMYSGEVCFLCREVYPQIASKYNTTSKRVERCIRNSIRCSLAAGTLCRLNDLFGFKIVDKYAPTNSELITDICTWIRLEKIGIA